MKSLRGIRELKSPLPCSVVSIGNFDGLHRGHRALIDRLLELARNERCPSVVYTFDPHPAQVLHPEKGLKNLNSREELLGELRELGIDLVILEPFTKAFSAVSPEEFVHDYLVVPLQPRHLVVGHDFAFGSGRGGSVPLLKKWGEKEGFLVSVVEPVTVDGVVVSSSKIREALANGQVELATKWLGRPFTMRGRVVQGAGRGQGLGFATANLAADHRVLPKLGVYVTTAEVNGVRYPAVTNVGIAPTFTGMAAQPRVETHILDQNLSLVGSDLRVHFLCYLREERRFANAAELVAQIGRDVEVARAEWAKRHEVGGHRP